MAGYPPANGVTSALVRAGLLVFPGPFPVQEADYRDADTDAQNAPYSIQPLFNGRSVYRVESETDDDDCGGQGPNLCD